MDIKPVHITAALYDQLHAKVEQIKSTIFNVFEEKYVSDEFTIKDVTYDAWSSIKYIDPSKGSFKDGAEIKKRMLLHGK